MKFMDLALGQKFELEGEIYVRTGPLVASHAENSKQRFMARYVSVTPLGESTSASPQPANTLSSGKVNIAFENYHAQCLGALEQLDAELPPDRLGALRKQIEQARQTFLDTLNRE
ncbi:MAG: hypothetical protein K8H84_04185 [Sulfuricella denitrificans]|nr:hypothetical protein [Sulfuricella denitrificans]